LRQLHWLPVQRRVEFKIACIVHQSLASLAPTYLTTDIHLVSEYGRRPLRSSTDRTLTAPRTHNRFGDRSFAVAGRRLWNSLPISLRQISSYEQFRRYLKNHLFGIWEITAQCNAWFSALYKYSYLLTYLLTREWASWPDDIYIICELEPYSLEIPDVQKWTDVERYRISL